MRRLLSFLLIIPLTLIAQELPPVINFSPNDYQAGNQNWMISQTEDKNIYIANGLGLLEYNGAQWNLFPVPNNTIVRAVKVVGNKIFTGAYMEAGYWKRNGLGSLEYTTLLPFFPEKVHDGEQFWHIENIDDTVVFHSFDGVYFYNISSGKITVLDLPKGSPVTSLFKAGKNIYFIIPEKGIYTIEKGNPQLMIPYEAMVGIEVVEIFDKNNQLEIIGRDGKFYRWNGESLMIFNQELTSKLGGISVFSALELSNANLLLGSVENGIYHIDKNGNILHHFRQENGLQNNTVLKLFLDADENVWAALDNGLSVLNIDSPFGLYQDNLGKIGTVYTSFRHNEYLYLGTNQGLYYRIQGEKDFKIIEGTNGQVWNLQLVDDTLFCGHNNGTFVVDGNKAEKISERLGTWTVRKVKNKDGLYVQGHYNGFSFLKKNDSGYTDLPMIPDFPHSSKHIVCDDNGYLWIGNEHKGVYQIQLNDSLNAIKNIKNFTFENTVGVTSSVFKFNNSIYYSAKCQLFKYDDSSGEFLNDSELSKIFNEVDLVSGRVVNLGDEIWAFTENSLIRVNPSPLKSGFSAQEVFIPREIRSTPMGYENISRLDDNTYLLGLVNGYLLFEDDIYQDFNAHEVRIDKISKATLDDVAHSVELNEKGYLEYEENNIKFHYSIPEYNKFLLPVYSYRLNGFNPRWSEWSTSSIASFKNLPFGEYQFEVRGKVGNEITNSVVFDFKVNKPWYLSNTALFVYMLILIFFLFLVHLMYKRHHQKRIVENEKALRMKNLEAEQKIIKLQNEQLEKEMEGKSKELAASTMSLIKKNEFLSSIKEKLKESGSSSEVKSVIKTIDKDISDEDNWKFFNEAFNNADKDFFKKIKAKHPELTSNDLKLCAYLRLNLSSKEIAPLLNISVKSVEIKRYRLRKKMNLPREINLVDYILDI